jgi:hypothetical protein
MAGGLTGLLLLAVASLAAAAAWPWLSGPMLGSLGGRLAASATPSPRLTDMPPFGDFAETERRPLFVSGRRVIEPVAAPIAPPAPPSFDRGRLAGIVVTGDTRVALIRDAAGGRVRRVAEGEAIDGWIVKAISVERVVLAAERGGSVIEISISRSPSSEQRPAAPRVSNP